MRAIEFSESSPHGVRLAEAKDIDALSEICRRSFPTSLRWQARPLSQLWWTITLASDAAETWVVEEGFRVAGFSVLVINEPVYSQERSRRIGSVLQRFMSAMGHPLILINLAKEMFKRRFRKRRLAANQNLPLQWNSAMRTWIELISVDPSRRGKGLGQILLQHCESRTRELSRGAVGLHVASVNTSAKCFYHKQGYMCYQSNAEGESYAKFID